MGHYEGNYENEARRDAERAAAQLNSARKNLGPDILAAVDFADKAMEKLGDKMSANVRIALGLPISESKEDRAAVKKAIYIMALAQIRGLVPEAAPEARGQALDGPSGP